MGLCIFLNTGDEKLCFHYFLVKTLNLAELVVNELMNSIYKNIITNTFSV